MGSLLIAAVLLAQHPPLEAERLYDRANALFVAQKFTECEQALEEALRLDPKLSRAWTLRAKLAMAQNRFDLARESLQQAITADSASWYAHFLQGFLYHLQNDLPQALPPLEKARQLNPQDARPALYLGLTHESLGHTREALGFYEEAIRLEDAAGKPQAETLLTYARLLLLLGSVDECARRIDRALVLDPNSRDAYYERARLLLQTGDVAGAASAGETALRLSKAGITDHQIRYLLVRAYRMAGQEGPAARHAAALRATDKPSPN